MSAQTEPDFDYVIIGSGFGGSVSALRLAQKGYSVAVIEKGRRYRPEDFPESNWNLRKYFWMPAIGLYGIQALTLLKDVFILHGSGVGGGSLVYAANLLTPPDEVFQDTAWSDGDWKARLAPFYATARQMLGATPAQALAHTDDLLRQCAEDAGVGDTFQINDVGIYFGDAGETADDPFFGGDGPQRTGCTLCSGCMVGCRVGAKNTLDANYLYLAEKLGVKIFPETKVLDVRPGADETYLIRTKRVGGLLPKRNVISGSKVIFSAGVLGTVKLLLKCRDKGLLPDLSEHVGDYVRTNSEALVGAKAGSRTADYTKGIAIAAGIFADANTYIETVRYGAGQDVMSMLSTPLVGGGGRLPRPMLFILGIFRHPLRFLVSLSPFGWARRAVILLVMQTRSNYMRLQYRRRWWRFGFKSMNSYWDTDRRVPSYIPVANEYALRMADKLDGDAFSVLPEVVFDTSSTAHILGGAIMGSTAKEGVVDTAGRIHRYQGLYVVDGSVVPVNLGVNPSLTITALAEYIMDQIPAR